MLEVSAPPKSAGMFSGKVSEGLVLIVDDEPDVRTVVRMILEKSGYTVIEAEDGEKAIQQVKSGENPLVLDLIITDIRMPKLNGLDAIQFFQKEFPRKPIVVLTGHPDIETATNLMKQGIVDYLAKPVEKEKLLTAVAKGLKQRENSRL